MKRIYLDGDNKVEGIVGSRIELLLGMPGFRYLFPGDG